MTDALASASIKNNMTSSDQIKYWRNTLFQNGTPSDSDVLGSLDRILSNTTIKRACCLRGPDPNNFSVNVRIPIPKDYSTDIPDINNKFGYIDKAVTVPASMCKGLQTASGTADYVKPDKNDPSYSGPCDDFYAVYCANMRAFYNDEYQSVYPGSTPDYNKFSLEYKPECACFNPNPTIPPGKLPYGPLCLMYPNCTAANNDRGVAYLDSMSRSKCPDSLTICNQVLDLSNSSAGGNIVVSPGLSNQCGMSSTSGSGNSSTTIDTSGSQSNQTNGSTTSTTGGGTSSGSTSGNTSGGTTGGTSGSTTGSTTGSTSGGTTSNTGGTSGGTSGGTTSNTVSESTDDTSIILRTYSGLPVYVWILLALVVVVIFCSCCLYGYRKFRG
jgi:hypothetical protein